MQPRSSDYLPGLRSAGGGTLGIGAGVDVGFADGWGLALQVHRGQSGDVAGPGCSDRASRTGSRSFC